MMLTELLKSRLIWNEILKKKKIHWNILLKAFVIYTFVFVKNGDDWYLTSES
jgi:hypothetical protein